MFVFIGNTPRDYDWGSTDALPEMLGTVPTGQPQAELWLGSHPGGPATVSKATPVAQTLIDLIESDPERYGVDGRSLPFLLKVLAIGSPLSLQVHPSREQAVAGCAAEDAAGIPRDAPHRNYRDDNHKPELVVALGDGFRALCGFRPLGDAAGDVRGLARALPGGPERALLERFADRLDAAEGAEEARRAVLAWAFGDSPQLPALLAASTAAVAAATALAGEGAPIEAPGAARLSVLERIAATHPGDAGLLVSLLMHLVSLESGEALFLQPGQLHAYVSGMGVEVMAASDNVLRAGLTSKHVDLAELCRVLDPGEAGWPRLAPSYPGPGLTVWQPPVPDFLLARLRLAETDRDALRGGPATEVRADARYPIVAIVTSGRLLVERRSGPWDEVASVGRGQSLYISAGESVTITGVGEAFVATVGGAWPKR